MHETSAWNDYGAMKKYPNIKVNELFMIGDSKVDIDLAINMNMRGFGIEVDSSHSNVIKLTNISDLVSYI